MKKRILIIDDDPSVRQSLHEVLRDAGYSAATAADGLSGKSRLKTTAFDLLVLDLNLPGLSGFDILDFARVHCAKLPIVILTGLIDQCEPGALAGADALFEKPPDVPALLQRIKELLREPSAKRLARISSGSGAGQTNFTAEHGWPGIAALSPAATVWPVRADD
jgi:DNA-binding response OmpR family regulator